MKQPYLTVRRSISPAKGMGPIYVFDSHLGESKATEKELLEQCMEALGQVFGKRVVRAVASKFYGVKSLASQGGSARAKSLSKAERKRIAKAAASARWGRG